VLKRRALESFKSFAGADPEDVQALEERAADLIRAGR